MMQAHASRGGVIIWRQSGTPFVAGTVAPRDRYELVAPRPPGALLYSGRFEGSAPTPPPPPPPPPDPNPNPDESMALPGDTFRLIVPLLDRLIFDSTGNLVGLKNPNANGGDLRLGTHGVSTQSGTGAQTAFNIAHGMTAIPATVVVTPGSSAAAALFYVTADATNIVVTFSAAPASGTNNVVLNWSASV